ncbi:MAG: cation:proton antiporter [Candidatus Micrarchaeia archaeon]
MEGVSELVLVFIFSLLGLIAAVRLRLPPIMGILLIGALVGPNALGWISNSEMVNSFSEIGAILLLFVIGIEFSINKIMKFGVRAILVAFLKITSVFVIVYETAILLGFNSFEALILGNIFAVTSTTLFTKLIKGTPEQNKEEINLMFAVLILEDIFSVFFLAVISSLPATSGIAVQEVLFSIVKSLAILVIVYFFLQKFVQAFFDYILKFKTEEMLVFASLSVCAIFAFLSSAIGLEASIGAFLAGSMMASLREFKKIEKTMLPFGLFFSSFFFLSIGMMVNFSSLLQDSLIIIILIGVSILAKFASISVSTYFLGYTSRAAVFSGLTMLTVGEFSLLIAKKSQLLMGFDIIGIVSVSVFISALISSFVIRKDYEVDEYITSSVPPKLKTIGRHVSRYINSVVVEFEPTGKFFRASMKQIQKMVLYAILLIIINGVLLLFENFISIFIPLDGWLFLARILIHLLISLGLLIKFFTAMDIVMSEFVEAFRKTNKKQVPLERRVIYDGVIVVLLLAAATLIPMGLAMLNLPQVIGSISLLFLLISIFYAWDAIKCANALVQKLSGRKQGYKQRAAKNKIMGHLVMFLNV